MYGHHKALLHYYIYFVFVIGGCKNILYIFCPTVIMNFEVRHVFWKIYSRNIHSLVMGIAFKETWIILTVSFLEDMLEPIESWLIEFHFIYFFMLRKKIKQMKKERLD